MSWGTLQDIAAEVNGQKVSAAENVEKALLLANENKDQKSLISLVDTRARERAKEIDERIARGENVGRLAGVPFVAKDNFLTFGGETTAASNIFKGFHAPYQATAIEKLEAEGAICIGKANLDAFAHGASTEHSDFYTTKNPHDPSKVPGGSSGGSAAAVSLGIVPFALGTDTGGSIRLPASYCGVVGLKPTYGLVSRNGVVAMASSTDCIGPLTRNVEDAALVLDIMAGKDPADSTTIEREASYALQTPSLSGAKVGVVREFFSEGLASDVRASVEKKIEELKAAGATIVDIDIPTLPHSLGVYYIICPAEVSSNLGRYDGQRYGYSNKNAEKLVDSYELSRAEGFGDEAKRRIMIGTYVLSSGYYDAYYKKAALVRTKLIAEFNRAFSEVDFLVGPVAPTTAFAIGENNADPLQMYLVDIMTVAANLVGVPSISIPVDPSKESTMPIGLQIMARQGRDSELLTFAAGLESI